MSRSGLMSHSVVAMDARPDYGGVSIVMIVAAVGGFVLKRVKMQEA